MTARGGDVEGYLTFQGRVWKEVLEYSQDQPKTGLLNTILNNGNLCLEIVFILYWCHRKLSQTQQLVTTQIYYPTILQVRSSGELHWILPSGFLKAKTRCYLAQVLTWRLWRMIYFQAHSGCQLNLCGYRTEVPLSLALSAGDLSSLLSHAHSFSHAFPVTASSHRGSGPSHALTHSVLSFQHNPLSPVRESSLLLRNHGIRLESPG